MERFLREWRQDALNKHQYESAVFIGDKLLALTNNDKDAFWLAQVHFSTGNYTRAQSFLARQDLVARNPSCRYLSAHCFIKQGRFEEALTVLGEKNPTHLISTAGNSRRKLLHAESSLRNGSTRHTKTAHRSARVDRSEERDREDIANIRFEAAMCFLRGICYAKQNAFDRAKECYKDAVRIDVQCFEAFDQLMKNCLMSPDEEWAFLESLDFDSISVGDDSSSSQEAAEFTRMLYTTRLSKYKNPAQFATATETLSTHYNLASNPDLLLAKAELLFTQCRFKEALAITESILATDRYNFSIYPLHLACLHELNQTNALFLISHDLADHHPEEPCSWLAVGVYYLTTNKIAEARRFFSKASMMDPHFGPAWIGFAHTFAAEGEHDQAISAYSTAARLFQGTHLPQLFLGMQNLQLNNMTLAQEYLNTAYQLCKTDPLLLNELGVVFYHQEHFLEAVNVFRQALHIAKEIDSDPRAWVATRANLAHAYRRMGRLREALIEFDEVLREGGRDAGIFCAKGLVLLELGRSWESVVALHEALAISPQDPVATELLGKALDESASVTWDDAAVEEEFQGLMSERRKEVELGRRSRAAVAAQKAAERQRAAAAAAIPSSSSARASREMPPPRHSSAGRGRSSHAARSSIASSSFSSSVVDPMNPATDGDGSMMMMSDEEY
ncbi:cell division cycle protein-like protein [Xylona heveae TC161]|uniref:Cell division cycle protein-like protein n=1 Tax=Xylona heveae (strain CBS 132557 / TC161) TaxID=1328760 RepID=A0A165AAS4_XYLHT|nr:cell division cycle protein-like protein [Xylona heveae TC161]KZF20184.1 cell division cycle protein-like protein [Xylona heveae TC161]